MGNKYGDIRWKWLNERGFNVLSDRHQYAYMQSLWTSPDLVQGVFCESPAGTGKTVLAVLAGAYAVLNEEYDRIIYIRNAVPVRDQGFLPGDNGEKDAPYMSPLAEALEYVNPGTFEEWSSTDNGNIPKVVPLTSSYARGITWDRSFIIIDEAQNFDLHELRTVYTRPTDTSKIVTTGSNKQVDNQRLRRYAGMTPIDIYMKHFEGERAVRHKLETNYRGWFSNHADNVDETIREITGKESM